MLTDRLKYGASPLHAKLRTMDALISIAKKQDLQQHMVSGEVEKQVVMARHSIIQEGQDKTEASCRLPTSRGLWEQQQWEHCKNNL